jgi:hypothetical protein
MTKPFYFNFEGMPTTAAIVVPDEASLPQALNQLALPHAQPVIVIVGGAKFMSEEAMSQTLDFFSQVVVKLAEEQQAVVIDGGTDSGVMQLIGQARKQMGATFPLVGVLIELFANWPGKAEPFPRAKPLEPNHTHFIFTPGDSWGDEVPFMAEVATLLASGQPSITIMVNGGDVTYKDAHYSQKHNRPVVTVSGSGRTADEVAAAVRGEETDEKAIKLVANGNVYAVELNWDYAKTLPKLRQLMK